MDTPDVFCVQDSTILLVDDNEINLMAAGELLRIYGAQVIEAATGAQAVSLCADTRYDIIFMDYMMPEMDGCEATRSIRAGGFQNADTPIVGLTADTMKQSHELLLLSGMNDVIEKPIDIRDFDRILLKYIPAERIIPGSPEIAKPEKSVIGFEQLADKLSGINFDARKALEGFDGNESSYIKVFRTFANGMPMTITKLESTFEQKDWRSVMIGTHAIKSAAATVGAYELSAVAREFEAASRMNDEQEMFRLFPELHGALKAACEVLPEIFLELDGQAQDPSLLPTGDRESLRQSLAKALELFEYLEHDDAMETLAKEAAFNHGAQINDALTDIKDKFDSFSYDDGNELIAGLLERL